MGILCEGIDCFQVSCINSGSSQEIFSFSFGGSNDNLLAAGAKSQVLRVSFLNLSVRLALIKLNLL